MKNNISFATLLAEIGRLTLKYRLTILWDTGERELYFYDTEEKAQEIEAGYKMSFGNQISYTCIERVHKL